MTDEDFDLVEAGANVFVCIIATGGLAVVGLFVWGML
jgi:hypothetical protein